LFAPPSRQRRRWRDAVVVEIDAQAGIREDGVPQDGVACRGTHDGDAVAPVVAGDDVALARAGASDSVPARPLDPDAAIPVRNPDRVSRVAPDDVPHDQRTGHAVEDPHADASVPGNHVGESHSAYAVSRCEHRRVQNHAFGQVGPRQGSRDVETDEVGLHQIVARPVVDDAHARLAVARDHVSAGGIADDVSRCALTDRHAESVVAQDRTSRQIQSDEVPEDAVAKCLPRSHHAAECAGDHVAGAEIHDGLPLPPLS
jgi:hypothetical protein